MSQVDALAADLSVVGEVVVPLVEAAVSESAEALQNEWRSNAAGSSGQAAAEYPDSITWDPKGPLGAEIGPDKGLPQGPLGNLLEFGSVNNPPHSDGQRAMESKRDEFAAKVAVAGSKLW